MYNHMVMNAAGDVGSCAIWCGLGAVIYSYIVENRIRNRLKIVNKYVDNSAVSLWITFFRGIYLTSKRLFFMFFCSACG